MSTRKAELDIKCGQWASIYRVLKAGGVSVGHPESVQLPPQFKEVPYPHLLTTDKIGNELVSFDIPAGTKLEELYYPILFLYPQYNQIDVLHHAYGDSLLGEQLALMFPEEESVSWDRDKEYSCSELVCYLVLQSSGAIANEQDWVKTCTEVAFLNGILMERDMKLISYTFDNVSNNNNSNNNKSSNNNSNNNNNDNSNNNINNNNNSSSSGGGVCSSREAAEAPTLGSRIRKQWDRRSADFLAWRHARDTTTSVHVAKTVVELPMGLPISSIYLIPGAVLPGGITTLLTFPKSKSNGAHKKFLDDQQKLGFVFRRIGAEGLVV
jgi:hypothetical protein